MRTDQVFDELERLGYDCELRRSGVLTIARTPAELAMCRAEYAAPPCPLWHLAAAPSLAKPVNKLFAAATGTARRQCAEPGATKPSLLM